MPNRVVASVAVATLVTLWMVASGGGMQIRAAFIATVCLFFWLTEWLPVWLPTLLLWTLTPVLLRQMDGDFALHRVIAWSLNPVIALFLAGFAFAAAAREHGIDRRLAAVALRFARGSPARLVAAAAFATAFLSMWVSNVAAAALMIGAFSPIWKSAPAGSHLRRTLLLGIALAANVGGVATPIGTGPNGIAMAAVADVTTITFLQWMVFGVPLALCLLACSLVLVLEPGGDRLPTSLMIDVPTVERIEGSAWFRLGATFGMTILLWLTEPLHRVPAWMVALGAVVTLIALRVLRVSNFLKIDWGTLLLVAGGIGLGSLLDRSGVGASIASALPFHDSPGVVRLLALCLLSAVLSALMSNTGTVAMLVPVAAAFDPAPTTAIIIAVASSLGMPFVVSTPPNAMAVASGLRSTDLLRPGIILMVGGCILVALTGPWILRATGIP